MGRQADFVCMGMPFWNGLFTTSCFDFSTNLRKFARRAENALGQSEHSSVTFHSILYAKLHFLCSYQLPRKRLGARSVLGQRKQ